MDYPTCADHDYDHPDGKMLMLKVYAAMHDHEANPLCRHCHEGRVLMPLSGKGWGWGSIHQPHCPEHEDNQEPAVFRVVDNYGGPEHLEAEAIWDASRDDAP